VPIYSPHRAFEPPPIPSTSYRLIRDDGHTIVFHADASGLKAPTGETFRLGSSTSGLTVRDAEDTVETYNGGRLSSIQYRNGTTVTLAYASNGRLDTATDSFGHRISFGYDASNRLSVVTAPDSSTVQYGYDSAGRLSTVTNADGTTRTYLYERADLPTHLTGLIDESSARVSSWEYDEVGRGIATEEAGGANRVSLTYNSVGSVTATDALGAVRTFTFERIGHRYRAVAISGSQCPTCRNGKQTTYDAFGFLASRRDYNDNLSCFANDSVGRELVRIEGFAPSVVACPANLAIYTPAIGTRERKVLTTWHATFRLPTSITSASRTTSFTHDASGNVLTRTVTDTSVMPNVSRTWTYTYNSSGQVLTEDGPRTDVADLTTYTYYDCTTGAQCGQLHTVTNAAGHVTTFDIYNAQGRPTQFTNPNGLVVSVAYDTRQRMKDLCVGSTLPGCTGGEITHADYWPTGMLKKVTNPDGSFVQYTYDVAHRLTQIQDGVGNKIVFTLDAMGNPTTEDVYDASLVLRRTHSRVFNTLNQLWKDVNAAGTTAVTTTFGYDGNGNQSAVAAPLGRSSSSLYDELDRLKQVTDSASGVTQFGYDADDNLTSVSDPRSLVTSYAYTAFGDLKTQTSPDTGLTTNTYDSAGNLKTSTDARNAVTTYTYDALDRVTSAAFKIGTTTDQTVAYTYDGGTNQKGLLTGASDARHSMSWAYDAKGRVIGKSQAFTAVTPNITRSIGYGYNAAGQLASTVLPSGSAIQFGYGANSQVTSVTLLGSPNVPVLSNVTYDPFGPVTGWTWGNGTSSMSRIFDADGKLTAISNAPAALGSRAFGYDDAFRITSTTDSAVGGPSWTFGYDTLDRLNSATRTGTAIGYTYDANGNRSSQTGTSTSTYTVSDTSNKLSATSGALSRTYTYDAAGNTLTTGATVHTYNNRGRMKTGRLASTGTNTSYDYNALGQRMRKGGGTPGTVYFMYDEAGHLVGEYNSTGALVQETVWLGDIPVATLRPKTGGGVDVFYVHTDQLNTPRKVTRPSDNQLRWKWDPTPFGEGAPNENPAALGTFKYNLRFPGQYFDVETNLNYNYFRDYDPAIGRYVQSDPIGIAGGIATYGFVGANPLSFLDPFGLNPLNFGDGYTGRLDAFNYQGDASFEIHVFDKNGKEVGVYGPRGWINKHGFNGPPKGVPINVCDSVKGVTIDELRKRGRFPPKGSVNIKGDKWKYFVKFGGAAAVVGNIYSMLSTERLCGMDPEHPACAGN
jgi:RHS repeat-associated protein